MGSINTRANGLLFFDFRFQGVRCREYSKLEDTSLNRKRMEDVLKKIEAEITLGTFEYSRYFPNSPRAQKFEETSKCTTNQIITDTPMFKDFVEEWFSENQIRWKESYQRIVRGTLDKYLIQAFGEQEVGTITKADILKFRASLAKVPHEKRGRQLSNDRINHIITPLRMILDEAADRFDFSTPIVGLKPLKVARQDVDPFSLEEVHRFLEEVPSLYRNYYVVRFFTGLRTGEIDGLQWQYVDFANRQILVRETIVQGKVSDTKTPESRREVDMSAPVYDALKSQHEVTGGRSIFVFSNRTGGPLEHRNVTQRIWYPLLEHLGMKKRRPYQTRHTAATLWLGAGENPEWIARQMGHTTTQMLFTVYSRYVPNLTRKDGSAMDNLLRTRGFSSSETNSSS